MDKLEELNKKESKLKLIFNILSIIIATLGGLVSLIIILATLTNTIDVPINTIFTTLGIGLGIAILIFTALTIGILWIIYAIIKWFSRNCVMHNNKILYLIPIITVAIILIIYLLYVYIL